jgi:alkylation response protein AidB-like acyl-CoA dehydrogenase
MDFLTASALLPARTDRGPELAVVLVPAASLGLERRAFWGNPVLAAAESDEIVLRDVPVPPELVFPAGSPDRPDPLQIDGFLWFELLISASYLGAASALVERVLRGKRGEPGERTLLGIEMEGAMAGLEGLARAMAAGQRGEDELARALFVRYAVQRAIERATAQAVELLGGMAFIGSSDVGYLFAAARALAFHPPSRPAMANALAEHLVGEPLRIR